MKFKIIFFALCIFSFSNTINSQTLNNDRNQTLTPQESLEFIAGDLQDIARLLKTLDENINKAYGKIAENLGLSLTDNQRKLLVSFEILNRAELRLTNLQNNRIKLLKQQSEIESEIAEIDESLRDENIQRSVSTIGTTDARELRNVRRAALAKKLNGLNNILSEIQLMLSQTNSEIRQTSFIVESIRRELFPAIQRELPRLDPDY